MGVADAQGTVRAATGGLLRGQSVAQRPWFQRGQAGPFVGDVHPAKLLATLMPADRDGEPQRFVDYAAPVVRDGQRLGVLGVHASWDWLGEVVDAVLSTQVGGSGIEIFIYDREGRVIFAPRGQSQKLAAADARMPALRGSAPGVVRWHDGAEWLTAGTRLPASRELGDLRWTVVARETAATVFGDVRDASRHVLVAGVLAALVGALMVRFAAVRLGADVRRLSKAARDIELGVPGAHLPPAASSAELRSLSEALGRMTTRLMATQDGLERQVRERTAELQAANAELGRQAGTDPLTGLPNRRTFDLQLEHALAAARRHGQPVAVLMIDADPFKRINDLHGHPVGDDVLVMLAGVLRAACAAARERPAGTLRRRGVRGAAARRRARRCAGRGAGPRGRGGGAAQRHLRPGHGKHRRRGGAARRAGRLGPDAPGRRGALPRQGTGPQPRVRARPRRGRSRRRAGDLKEKWPRRPSTGRHQLSFL